jgi:isoquinoline 1-oxidoreductase
MDQLARRLKIDPLAFRLKNLKEPRLRAVLEAATKAFGWGTQEARRVTATDSVAARKRVPMWRLVRKSPPIHKLRRSRCCGWSLRTNAGAIVNPDQLKNQIEGAIVMGLGGALFEAIDFENGAIKNPRFSKYRVRVSMMHPGLK